MSAKVIQSLNHKINKEYLVWVLNLPFGVIIIILGGLNGKSLGKTNFP